MKIRLILLLALSFMAATAQKSITQKLEDYVNSYTSIHGFSGNILIAKKGEIVYQKVLGQANREWAIPNTADTRFYIASLTKQFTAAAILQLEEKGKLKTSDKLSKFFPDFPKADSITIHMLLNHTAGIKGDSGDSIPEVAKISPNIPVSQLKEPLINTFKNRPFEFSPGKGWSYSNAGYILLGYIVEQCSGQAFRDYLYDNIFIKAGMKDSDLSDHNSIIPRLAYGYNLTPEGQWKRAKFFPMNTGFAVGGIYSTVGDLLKWNKALMEGKIISAGSFEKMHRPNHGSFGAGYGIFVDDLYGHKVYQHQGALEGYNTYMSRFPEEDICIIVLSNKDTNLDFIPKSLAAIMLEKEVVIPQKRKPVTVDAKTIKRLEGIYEGGSLPFPLTIVTNEGKLYWRMHRDIELVPESESRFYINEQDVEIQIEFVATGNQKPESVIFTFAGVRVDGKRKV